MSTTHAIQGQLCSLSDLLNNTSLAQLYALSASTSLFTSHWSRRAYTASEILQNLLNFVHYTFISRRGSIQCRPSRTGSSPGRSRSSRSRTSRQGRGRFLGQRSSEDVGGRPEGEEEGECGCILHFDNWFQKRKLNCQKQEREKSDW